jgi:hypothetical protein
MKVKSFTELEHLVIRVVALLLLLIAGAKVIWVELLSFLQ